MRRWLRRLLVVAVLGATVLGLRATVLKTKPVPVRVVATARGRVEATVTNSKAGTIQTRRRASLSPELGGRVAQLLVRDGDRVIAGQPLLRLADAEYLAQVALQQRVGDTAREAARQACLDAELAGREQGRQEQLVRQEILSVDRFDQIESRRQVADAACAAARARMREAAAALDLARVALSKTTLSAPFDGVVSEVRTEVGEWITPSPPGVPLAPVIEMLDRDAIYVSAPIDEVDLGRVRVDQTVRVTADALPGAELAGRVVRIAPYVLDREGQNRTVEIEVELADPAAAASLLPGTSADVEVVLDAKDDALRIPTYALMEGGKVLVVRDGRLHEVTVTTGLRNWQHVEITRGLAAGDEVVVSLDRVEVQAGAEAVITEREPT